MSIRVNLPGGAVANFPDGTPLEEIERELSNFSQPSRPSTPPPPSATIGMLAQSTAQGDPVQKPPTSGMSEEQWSGLSTGEKMRNLLQWGGRALGGAMGMGAPGELSPVNDAVDNPGTTLAIAAAPLALRKAPGILARATGLSKARAGENIQAATTAAGKVPLNVEKIGAEGLRAVELQQAGGSMPRVASRLMQRITDPNAADLTFTEARDYYNNLSRLSSNEFGRLNPTMKRQIGAMRAALHEALVGAADTVGAGKQYQSGISEYARASKAATTGKRAAAAAGIGLSADYLMRKVLDSAKGSLR